jgi:CRISPR type IV-associated protein Csf3
MKQFKVAAVLKTPVIYRGFWTLDAILAAIKVEQGATLEDAHSNLPLKNTDGLWWASAAIASGKAHKVGFIANIKPMHDVAQWFREGLILANKKGQIHRNPFDTTYTAVMTEYQAKAAEEVTWHATGDADAVAEMLEAVQFIGARRTAGWGEVQEWEITSSDLDGVHGHDGQPMRPVPVQMWDGSKECTRSDVGWRPAYWDINNRAECFVGAANV